MSAAALARLRRLGRVVDGINKTFGAEAVELRHDIRLDLQHVRRSVFLRLAQQLVDAFGAIRRIPLEADRVRIPVGRNAAVGGRQDARRRIEHPRHLIVRNEACPLVSIGIARNRQRPITRRANRNESRRLVADVAIHVGIDHVLPRRAEESKTRRGTRPSSSPSSPRRTESSTSPACR